MNDILFSIIVPVYKSEKYLKRCLDSISSQTFSDWECILVDDGSPDMSGSICDLYVENDTRFKVIHKLNGGVSSARNAALDIAIGKWVLFVDSDDQLVDNAFELILESLEIYKANLYVFTMFIQKNGKFIQSNLPFINGLKLPLYELVHHQLLYTVTNGPVCKLFLHSMIKDIRFPVGVKIGEDFLFGLKYNIINHGDVVFINKPIYRYYEIDSSAINSQSSFRKEYNQLSELTYKQLIDYCLYDNFKEEFNAFQFINLLTAIKKEKSYPSEKEALYIRELKGNSGNYLIHYTLYVFFLRFSRRFAQFYLLFKENIIEKLRCIKIKITRTAGIA